MPATPTLASSPAIQHSTSAPASSPLQACPHCEALFDTTEREPLETIACPGCGSPIQIGGEIAGFQLIEVAGRGGMGVVYKAYDPGLDRHIAIKLLRKDHSADRRLIEQLETEATITASITDPNVVRVYATGLDHGRFYLAMELVDKGSLDDLIRLQGRVAEAQALEVGIQIAAGLRAALQHGLIHRDVKPGNILFGDSRTAKIVDFGLATFMHQMEESSGEIWGTPYYIPPEKLDGGVEDFRSDIYSLGASLFHGLAGRPPFDAPNATLVAIKHIKSQAVSLQAFAPWVSNPTAHIINRTLAKNPADRFQSYDDLIHNLQYALDQLQQGGGKPQTRARVVLETEEDRKTWTWVVLGMAAVIIVLLGIFVFARPKSQSTTVTAKATAKPAAVQPTSFTLGKEVNALGSGEPNAADLLQAAVDKPATAADERAWAQFLVGTAHLVAGRAIEAQMAFQKVENFAAKAKDPELSSFLKTVSAQLSNSSQIPPSETRKFATANHEVAAYLLHGLHNWQLGALEDATASLRQFRSSKISGPAAWLGDLKPIATGFVERLVNFQMAVESLKTANNPAGRAQAARTLRKLDSTFAKRAESEIAPFAKEISEFEASLTALPSVGLYRIYNKHSNRVIDVNGRQRNEGAKIHQWSVTGGANQIWELIPVADNTFKLRAAHSGLLLNLPRSSTKPGATMWQWKDDGTSAGIWKLEPQGDGWFFIRSASSNQVLAVDGMNKSDGGSITQWDKPGSADHFWRFERVGSRLDDWNVTDFGGIKGPASTKIEGDTISLAVNNDDIWNESDSCRFIFREADGDFDFVAKLSESDDLTDWTKAGIMVRNSILATSRNILFGFSGRRGVIHQRRREDNAPTTQEKPKEDLKPPGWIKLSRRGSTFTGFYSTDGNSWNEVTREDFSFGKEVVVGLAASSWMTGKTYNARFDNVALTKP
jgi:eukaryotic-like serine/threonine-protein kinase